MNYEIQIGEVIDFESNKLRPQQIIIITEEQLQVVERFASTRKDEDLNTIYKLNDCEFKILPQFKKPTP